MRYVTAAVMLLGLSGYAAADEMSDAIVAGTEAPYNVLPCSEQSTGKIGLCGFFRKDRDTYIAFRVSGVIQWVKRIPDAGETEQVYTVGQVDI